MILSRAVSTSCIARLLLPGLLQHFSSLLSHPEAVAAPLHQSAEIKKNLKSFILRTHSSQPSRGLLNLQQYHCPGPDFSIRALPFRDQANKTRHMPSLCSGSIAVSQLPINVIPVARFDVFCVPLHMFGSFIPSCLIWRLVVTPLSIVLYVKPD